MIEAPIKSPNPTQQVNKMCYFHLIDMQIHGKYGLGTLVQGCAKEVTPK